MASTARLGRLPTSVATSVRTEADVLVQLHDKPSLQEPSGSPFCSLVVVVEYE